MEIKKIRVSELESFIQSETFKNLETIPITTQRAISYVNNPNARPDDIALFLGFLNNKLLAFRSVFAGETNTIPNSIRFGWCSGNWVHPDYRRKGFSELLLNEAFIDWDEKLMFTNYAPNSENQYLKTGKFYEIHQFEGFRGYLFPNTRKLISLANRNWIFKTIFSILNIFILFLSTIRLWFFKQKTDPKIRFETIQFPDETCYQLLDKSGKNEFFKRGVNEMKWIFEYPWISADKNSEFEKYPFSGWSNSFLYQTVKVFSEDQFSGFFIFSVREGHLKTLYFNIAENMQTETALYLKEFCKKHKIEVATIYNSEIAQQLFKRKFPFLHAKKYGQKIYSSFQIEIGNQQKFQDGDGDAIFT